MSTRMTHKEVAAAVDALFADVVEALTKLGHSATYQTGHLAVDGVGNSIDFSEELRGSGGFHHWGTGRAKIRFRGLDGPDRVAFRGRTFKQRKDGTWPVDKIAKYAISRAATAARYKAERLAKEGALQRWEAALDRLEKEFPDHLMMNHMIATSTGIKIFRPVNEEQARALLGANTETDHDG